MYYDDYYLKKLNEHNALCEIERQEKSEKALKKRERLAGRPMPDFCDMCSKPRPLNKPLYWDHDHKTGKFRGWLCNKCNSGLGTLGDTIEAIEMALNYLKSSS